MSTVQARQHRLELPQSLRAQLGDFRRRVWSVKMAEAAGAAVFIAALAFLALFALDRVWDTPAWPRFALFALALAGCAALPLALQRWVWNNRKPDQLARLIGRKHPQVGDQLLGVIELVGNEAEQARSRRLCEAAVAQVAADASRRDFHAAVPSPRHRLWAAFAALGASAALVLAAVFPAAAGNAWARLLAPWKPIPRYTFAALGPLPGRLFVAHGEPFSVTVSLKEGSAWRPGRALAWLGNQPPVASRLRDGAYEFTLPSQIDPAWLDLKVGDARRRVRVEPTLRPELTSVVAVVTLPDYLGLPQAQRRDARGGSVSVVKGSRVTVAATAGRRLSEAHVNGLPRTPDGPTVSSPALTVDGPRAVEFRWRDELGLAGKEPFVLAVTGRDDEPPSLSCEGLPRQKVLLDSEVLSFKARARDDFGVKAVGLEWKGIDDPSVKDPAKGERVLAAGGHDKEALDLTGTFSAKPLGIEPQPVAVRVYIEDYLPGRPRVYSPTSTFYVLNPEPHAIWVTEQLSRWHRQSLEVRDREMQLFETNKQLRALTAEELDRPETRRRIESQAGAERANGRRLSGLVVGGEDLVRQASRNPEIGVGHLERWAEMLQVLKDISGNRMPSVADLLKQAASSPPRALASNATGNRGPSAGQSRAGGARPSEPSKTNRPPTSVPAVVDRESSQITPKKAEGPPSKSGNSSPRLTLPVTTLTGPGGPSSPPPQERPEQKLDEAVAKQRDLLAEFDKIADELNRVLANLEGSTLVKRLKAASRLQSKIGGRIGDQLAAAFGVPKVLRRGEPARRLEELAGQEAKGSHDVSLIMDDMQAYFERRRYARFKAVLDEMRTLDAVGSLRQLGDDLGKETGLSIAQCEFWSDTLDRWAEDLVDPAASGSCPGSKSCASLPPSVILEVLQILEAEVNLREETRVAQQARPALEPEEFGAKQAGKLFESQKKIEIRVEKVNQRIHDLPDSDQEFGSEMRLLARVADVMGEAAEILAKPETGPPAIAAETEAIELLLQSRRINPKGGGGGGPNPGGGGNGTTTDSALALLGGGVNDKEVREDHGVSQATGDAGPALPEEFRAGLDEYFNRLERRPGGE